MSDDNWIKARVKNIKNYWEDSWIKARVKNYYFLIKPLFIYLLSIL